MVRNTGLPAHRPLRAYAFDPTRGRSLGNFMTFEVPYEGLHPGPIGQYLAVIDYDASNDVYYAPVNLDDPTILIGGGLMPSEANPQFHQQMVYAVASETIRRFSFALGRSIKWGFRGAGQDDPLGDKLRVYPHGVQDANAFYSRELRALVFGYFAATEADTGANLPGQTVFTCLSHDIVAHETTHALVDGQREFFLEATSVDSLAFHEAFADLVALFQHFSFEDALIDSINRTGGLLYRLELSPRVQQTGGSPLIQAELNEANPLVELARQFGEALGNRAALRSAIGTPVNSTGIERVWEPHERGAILVAAVFDAFFSIYLRRTADLLRIARAAGTPTHPAELHPELAKLLAAEAAKTAQHFSNICIRALDYCPPVDVRFGDFLRAMITADYDLVPDDPYGYRAALIDGFRLRGIRPEGVTSFSEESLRWSSPEDVTGRPIAKSKGLVFRPLEQPTRTQMASTARTLNAYGANNAELLGLMPGVPIQPHKFHLVHRIGPDGQLELEMVAELVQQRRVRLDPNDDNAPEFTFRGGTTLLFDHQGNVRYSIYKPLGKADPTNPRLQRQRAFFDRLRDSSAAAAYQDSASLDNLSKDLAVVHKGY
jgi:hypothetical protein